MKTATVLAPVGQPVPPFTPHAISVSLPTWQDNIFYEEGDKRVLDVMLNGYPRFFISLNIQKLAGICERKLGLNGERCILCPSKRVAEFCRAFMTERSPVKSSPVPVRLANFMFGPEEVSTSWPTSCLEIHIVFFPADAFPLAKQFWQHTGLGISSRTAERCLGLLLEASSIPTSPVPGWAPSKSTNRHYSVKPASPPATLPLSPSPPTFIPFRDELLADEHEMYLEERYGRNLPLGHAKSAKRALRRRIAGVLVHDQVNSDGQHPFAGRDDALLGPSSRGVEAVSEEDVYLLPTGMSAIWTAHQLSLKILPPRKSVCFGFPYTDTLKILEKWGPGCYFFGRGSDAEIDELEALLKELSPNHTNESLPPVSALFTEFPSNPLLRSADLKRLRELADTYGFLMVIDETIGNFVNVSVMPYADIVVSSLTKVFSGDSNVMGGSLVLNPNGKHYQKLKLAMTEFYEDVYFDEDAIYMERNSRDFIRRIHIINENTEAVCDFLNSQIHSPSSPSCIVKEVYYPKFTTRTNYDKYRNRALPAGTSNFGGLFSVTFTSDEASRAFFDNLECHKGPSLGTNFSLACPFTILAHYAELDWARGYGVEAGLVRVSVGMEDKQKLLAVFKHALKAAEDTVNT